MFKSFHRAAWRRIAGRLVFAASVATATLGAGWVGKWQPLEKDGMHDPSNPGLQQLQQPVDALSNLPRSAVGNQVDWVTAMEHKLIDPRANLMPGTRINILDGDVIMPRTGEMPMVRFSHRVHTEWLDCDNCHEQPFDTKAGGTKGVNMWAILSGEYCGLCHGGVAFPLTECNRCHSVLREQPRAAGR
ncbi:MAG: hypothetical protein QG662_1376 [Pseudomonadota bacterium]|nr:hypothetical protein [Pseudomonadota bacterium]